jgi:hypothetical protein
MNDAGASLPAGVMAQLMQLRADGPGSQARLHVDVKGRKVEISVMSPIGPDELLFRVTELSTTADEQQLQQTLSLTSRESEVLLWISRARRTARSARSWRSARAR